MKEVADGLAASTRRFRVRLLNLKTRLYDEALDNPDKAYRQKARHQHAIVVQLLAEFDQLFNS